MLDWELATLGDPLADVGTMLAYWTQADDSPVGLFGASNLSGFSDRSALVNDYCVAAGVDGDHIAYWHALGLWKIAIIAEGVYRRALDEPTNAAEGAGDPAGLGLIVKQLWDVVRSAGLV